MFEQRRGRPSGRFNSDHANFESIVLIASKHDVDARQLIDAFFEAWMNGSSHHEGLKISCRETNQDSAIFLVTKGEKVIWQFPVCLDSIRNPSARDYIQTIPIPHKVKKRTYEKNQTIGKLRFGMKGINVNGTIVEIPPVRSVFTRWGAEAQVSNVKLADEDESIRLSLWNHQIKTVHIGDEVELRNCSVSRFAGELQLKLGRRGSISVNSLD